MMQEDNNSVYVDAVLGEANTAKLQKVLKPVEQVVSETPLPSSTSPVVYKKKASDQRMQLSKLKKQDAAEAQMLQERCQQLGLTLFFREHAPVRSLGFTSSIGGEGKSFLALTTARVLARDSSEPVVLVECNWEHPVLHEYFDVPATPGLAEWLRGTCDEDDIRHQVDENLMIIPAGEGRRDAVKLLNQIRQEGLLKSFKQRNVLLIVELPPVITSSYGSLAASIVDTVMVVTRSEAISSNMLAETCVQLKDASVHGIILNQVKSRIPRWIQQLI